MKKITFYFLFVLATQLTAQEPVWNWVGTVSGDKQNIVSSIAVDKQGNSYSVGYFYSTTLAFNNITLTNTSSNNCDLFMVKTDRNGNIVWAKSAGGIASETTFSVAVDDAGNVYWIGSFASPQITFGNVTLNNSGPFTSDVFIAKYNPDGNIMWAKNYGGMGNDNAMTIKINTLGNIFVFGNFTSSTLSFGTFNLTNSGAEDIFLTKLDLNGNVLWAKSGIGIGSDFASDLAVDKSGNSYIVGRFSGKSLNFGTTAISNDSTLSSTFYISKFNKNGDVIWAKSASNENGQYIAIDSIGNAYVTGSINGNGSKFGTYNLINKDKWTYDQYLVKYSSTGNLMWAQSAGGDKNEIVKSIVVDKENNAILAGTFQSSSLSFGQTVLTSNGDYDIYLARYTPEGIPNAALKYGGTKTDEVGAMAMDANGDIFLAGMFNSPILNFGINTAKSVTEYNMFITSTIHSNNGGISGCMDSKAKNFNPLATMPAQCIYDSTATNPTKLTYKVQVPFGTYECYFAGEINGWTHQKMNKIDSTHYSIEFLNATSMQQYKYCSGPGWGFEENRPNGGNRTWSANDVVTSWAIVYYPQMVAEDVTYQVTVPSATKKCFISGVHNNWQFSEMNRIDSTHFKLTIRTTTRDKYKYSSGPDWKYAELDINYQAVPNRNYTSNDVVVHWAELFNPINTNPIPGCMDQKAKNYNPLATMPAPCIYDSTTTMPIYGCMDQKAKNYNPMANKPAQCIYDSTTTMPIYGCMDQKAKNYNPLATMPGQCIYDSTTTMPIYGCMDQKAKNYNPMANKPAQCIYDSTTTMPIYGCMHPLAKNYNPLANIPNGSCVFNDSTITIWGCMNPSATNFNATATKDDGKCQFSDSLKLVFGCMNPKALNFNKFATKDDGSCKFGTTTTPVYGCTNPVARNYNPMATIENGSCTFGDSTMIVWGCMNSKAVNYNPKAVKDNGTCIFGTTNIIFGCMNSTARNYNAQANKEDGSCIFVDSALIVWGCTNPIAKNFNPKATKENGTCIFVDSVQVIWGCTNVLAMNYNPKATMENGSCTYAKDASVIYGCTKSGALNFNPSANKENGSCIFKDSTNTVLGCNNPMAKNYNPKATKDNGTCIFQDSTKMILGCTNPTAKNYNRLATHENGTCVFSDEATKIFGCTKPSAKNFNPLATVENGSCVFNDTIKLPIYGCTNKLALNYSPQATVNNGTCKFDTIQLVMGCMDKKAINYNPLARVNNGSCKYDSIKTVYGCTDPIALNYNPLAKIDNKNCVYQTMIPGCMDELALNYNPYANVKDGSCKYPIKIWGCTDKAATNYNSAATHNDGNCQYVTHILGCTDPLATNYNPLATKDNRTCVFAPVVSLGCTNKQALNFNPNANTDNGTCVFETITDTIKGCMDKTALNYNPVATKPSGNCVYAGVSIAGCTSQMALNYNKAATIDDESCIFAKPVNIVLPVDKDILVAVKDTLVKIVENSCSFNFSIPIDTVYISSSSVININEIQVVWAIKQGSNITNVTSNYLVDKDGKALLFLSLVCNGGSSKVIVNGKYGIRNAGTSVEGVTVSSYYQVPSNTTRLLAINQTKGYINMYPNPVNDILLIEYRSLNAEKVTIQINSMDGKRMLSNELYALAGQNQFRVNTTALNEGIYMVIVRANSKQLHVSKLVKN